MTDTTETMRSHWWWRPGWRHGRSFYTWHLTFEDDSAVKAYASSHAAIIDCFSILDQVASSGLHVTLQGIGFTDQIDISEVEAVIEATRPYTSNLAPFSVTIGQAVADGETVQAPLHPISHVAELRDSLRKGIGDVWGDASIPESAAGFTPHLTLAYANDTGPASEIAAALSAQEPTVTRTVISAVSLINLNRDHQRYEWSVVSRLPLSAG